MEVYKV